MRTFLNEYQIVMKEQVIKIGILYQNCPLKRLRNIKRRNSF